MTTKTNEAKTLVNHISCDCKFKFEVQQATQIENGIIANANDSVKTIVRAQKVIITILACLFVRILVYLCEKYLKSIVDTLVRVCVEITSVADSVSTNLTNIISTNMTNTISTNVPSTVPINSDDKKVRSKIDCYILYTVLLY